MLQNIEMTGFRKACQKIRDELHVEDAESFSDLRDMYRDNINRAFFRIERPVQRTAEDLRGELITASVAAGGFGASRAQIDYIVSLCGKGEGYARMGYSRLTSKQASAIIASLKN